MGHLHQAVVALPEFTLPDGTKAKTEDYYPPQDNDDGEMAFGFDVAMDDGSHLGFKVTNPDWGGRVKAERAVKGPRKR